METGAFAFGAVIGWFTFYTMRYSAAHLLGGVAAVIALIGGAAVFALFPAQAALFGHYAIGLATGFFGYLSIMIIATVATGGVKGLLDASKRQNPFMNG